MAVYLHVIKKSNTRCSFSLFTVPSISAQIVNEVNPVLGGYYALTCYIFGAQNINPIVTYRWTKDAGNGIHAPVGMNSSALRFSSLRLSDAGQYTCHVTVRSLYLDNELVAVASHNVILKCKLKRQFLFACKVYMFCLTISPRSVPRELDKQ